MGDLLFLFFFYCTHRLKIQGTCSGCFIRHLLLLLLLWCDCFEAGFELLGFCLKGETQCHVTYNPPWHLTNISPGKALVSDGMEKNIREAMESQFIHFKGGMGGAVRSTALQAFIIKLSMYLFDSPLHNSSSSFRLVPVLPGLQVTKPHKCHAPRLAMVKSHREWNRSSLPTLLQTAHSTIAWLKGSWEQTTRTASCGAKTKEKKKKKDKEKEQGLTWGPCGKNYTPALFCEFHNIGRSTLLYQALWIAPTALSRPSCPPACPAVVLPLRRCRPQGAVAGGHRARCGRRDVNIQSEYRLSSAFPRTWPLPELPWGRGISSVKQSSGSRQALAVGAGCHRAGNLPPQVSGQKLLYVKTSSQRYLKMLDVDWIMCKNTMARIPAGIPCWAGRSGEGGCYLLGWHPRVLRGWRLRLGSQPFLLAPVPGHHPTWFKLLPLQDPPCSPSSSTRFFGTSQSGCVRHLAPRQPPLQLRQVFTKSKCDQRSSMTALLQSSALTGMRLLSRHLANGPLVLVNFLSVCKIFRLI